MSQNNNFDKTMERLNQYYDQMPTQSSSANIMANIKKKKKRNWARHYQRWQVAALIVLMIGIGYVLGVSQLSGQRDTAHQTELTADKGLPEESMSIAAVEEAEDQVEVFNAEQAETRQIPAELTDDEDSIPLEITNEEGMQEVIQVKPFQDDIFGFTTRYDERLVVEEVAYDEGRAIQWFFHNDNGRVEPVVLEIFQLNNPGDQKEQIEAYKSMMSEMGYREASSENYMKGINIPAQGIEELLFEKDGIYAHVIPAEHGENVYFFKTSLFAPDSDFIEFSGGFGRNVNVIYNEFSWIYN
ncbi:hypothetical protein [Halalkalibacter alkalisediminis]|uniref:Uncharacterized protein n=1 Tax=Halalkalibacter alkalisediminis TaxID=935616 RepID=A0ABV6NQQ4_9BACI|nr:hypothetical protein [Halalkalibacter alkalisediminis]